MEEVESREWYLAAYAAEGVPTSDHLKLRTVTLSLSPDSIPEQHVILEILFISVEPYLRSRITGREDGLYSPQFNLDEFVARRIDPNNGIPLPEYISSIGVPGFAAWVGIELLADPKPGSNVFISAAAGAVGMCAGQLAKLRGCRVIGSTGSDEKVRLIKEEFGYDDAFNYHTETNFDAALSKYFPNGIDVYLDNVGGEMLEAALNHVNKHAKVPLCGMISGYNKVWTEREGVRNLLNLIGKEVNMQGFMVGSYVHRFGDFATEMESHLKQGKIGYSKLKIFHGIETFLESLGSLFTSSNVGKVVIQVK
ncbi:2-alkenal reductase (NADP(+)-dependent)-like isoform X2 [Pyrus x bretschneideri]|uniref:2-alkenal reductase (NADP(+)-dependent)-like isoform X2 n=1 Tax=Pyrus x bretschneideri TaxID=225117 RepID=UPI000510B478|nr:2-alkenal reductase (NADP(+)-dependent)-like isoform X2 [Pyrus x bretschneideri]